MLSLKKTADLRVLTGLFLLLGLMHVFCHAQENAAAEKDVPPKPPVLKVAVLCEDLRDGKNPIPVNQAIVFSSELKKLVCFTDFEPVYEETYIFHKYYFKDKYSSRKTLKLYPPRWATYSEIQLRETDKGPWRVDITDASGKVLKTIRFSITD